MLTINVQCTILYREEINKGLKSFLRRQNSSPDINGSEVEVEVDI